jgi:hypothetical protein
MEKRALGLPLSHKIVVAHGSWFFLFDRAIKSEDFHHVIKSSVPLPGSFKTCRPVTPAIKVTAQLSDDSQGGSE